MPAPRVPRLPRGPEVTIENSELRGEVEILHRRVAELLDRVSRRESEAAGLRYHQIELEARIDALARAHKERAQLPRPLRILRKRLRSLGLLKDHRGDSGAGAPRLVAGADVLALARVQAPSDVADFLRPMDRYQAWCEANRFTSTAKLDLEAALAKAEDLPDFAIITPVYNTSAEHLDALVRSVLDQVYDRWTLYLVDDASASSGTRTALDRIETLDDRIQLVRLEKNAGISGATNAGVAAATAEVLLFLDHDDLITPDCLGEIALYYAAHPDADIVYSDDDKIDDQGHRFAPQFKPDWSPTLLLSFMYISHAFTVRRSLFVSKGGFDAAFDGSQDYDFALRAVESARHIGHVPKILYHWRATAGSTAVSGDAKPESFERGRQAVANALKRRGLAGDVVHPDWAMAARVGMFDIVFPDQGPSVTLVIPTYNKVDLLRDCLASLEQTTYRNYDVLVIDNGSDDPATMAFLSTLPGAHVRVVRIPQRADGFSYAALMNEAVGHVSADYVLLLNNDTVVRSGAWLSQMMGYAVMPGVGAVGARLYFGDETLQHAGIVHGYNDGLVGHAFRGLPPHDWGYLGFVRTAREYSAVTAACLLTPRRLYLEVNGLDEARFAVAYNDVDYCYRLVKAGYLCVYSPDAELFHFEGKSRKAHDDPREVTALRKVYGDWNDRWYNPNLSLENERFEVQPWRAPMRSVRPVRVVAFSHNLEREGAPNTLFDLLTGIRKTGAIDLIVLSPRDGPLAEEYAREGVQVELIAPPPVGCSEESFDALTSRVARRLQHLDADLVIANTVPMFVGIDAATRAGLPSIWCQHESEPWQTYFDAETPGVRARAFAAFSQPYRVTYVADATRRGWAPLHLRHNAVTIRHGIPPERLTEELGRWTRERAREQLGVGDDRIVLILMGTVCARKGQIDLAAALAGLDADIRRRLAVFIVGAHVEPSYLKRLKAELAQLGPDVSAWVTVTGAVPDMTLYYAAADISVCTSRIESAPRVLVESMAFGLPIISTPVFGIPEILDFGQNALSYPPGDATALAEAIKRLVNDDVLRRTLGATSPYVLESRPGYAEMVDQYTRLIREAVLLRSGDTTRRHS